MGFINRHTEQQSRLSQGGEKCSCEDLTRNTHLSERAFTKTFLCEGSLRFENFSTYCTVFVTPALSLIVPVVSTNPVWPDHDGGTRSICDSVQLLRMLYCTVFQCINYSLSRWDEAVCTDGQPYKLWLRDVSLVVSILLCLNNRIICRCVCGLFIL